MLVANEQKWRQAFQDQMRPNPQLFNLFASYLSN